MDSYIELAKQMDAAVYIEILRVRNLELTKNIRELDLELLRVKQTPTPLIQHEPVALPPVSNLPEQPAIMTQETPIMRWPMARKWIKTNPPPNGIAVDEYYKMYTDNHKYPITRGSFNDEVKRTFVIEFTGVYEILENHMTNHTTASIASGKTIYRWCY